MKDFIFESDPERLQGSDCFLAYLPAGLASKDDLLRALAKTLKFPAYFGGNWDALWDCIRDLSWISEFNIVLFHNDVPLASALSDRAIYLSALRDAARDWDDNPGDEKSYPWHELTVAFPKACKDIVEQYS